MPLTGLCRCCGEAKRCRVLNVEYQWQGQKEVYSDMFVDCFGLQLSHLDGDPEERGICSACVSCLRKSAAFRRRVLSCEEWLLKTMFNVRNDDPAPGVIVKIEKAVNLQIDIEPILDTEDNEPSLLDTPIIDVAKELDDGTPSNQTENMEEESAMKVETSNSPLPPTLCSAKADSSLEDDKNDYIDVDGIFEDNDDTSLAVMKNNQIREKLHKSKKTLNNKPKPNLTSGKVMKKGKRQKYLIDDLSTPCSKKLPSKTKHKFMEAVEKAYVNAVTIVENSYVCPFTTSFSDYYCTYCRHTFTDPSKLREHTLTHDPTTFKAFYDNKKTAQVDVTRIGCRLCPAKIDDIDELKEHLQKIHKKLMYSVTDEILKFRLTLTNLTCIECSASFKFFHALKKHMAKHFGRCICDVCGTHFFDKKTLLIHEKIHKKSDKKLFPCKDCGKVFRSRNDRNLHEKKIHKNEAAYPCSKCNEVFFTYPLRYRHLIATHGEDRKFACDDCDRVYDTRKSLREHNRKTHLKIMKHKCEVCERRFYQPSRLKEHMSTHTGERNYRCEHCGKTFPRLRGLKVHMQSHSAVKKYKCGMCTVSFGQNITLKKHMKRKHYITDGPHNS